MAIYSLYVSNVSRAAGSSTLATLSYITAERARDERLGQTFYGFGRRERVEATGTLLPEGAPTAWRDPEALFNAIEAHEKASNARCGKKIMVALPREWSLEISESVLRGYIEQEINRRGYAATYAIHTDKAGNNPHAHILIANRVIKPNGQWGIKQKKTFVLDDNGERVPLIDKGTGKQKTDKRGRKQWKRRTVESHPLDQKEVLKDLRKAWADTANKYLDAADQIDHRSLKEQGIDRLPTIHVGYAGTEMDKRGEHSERAERNETIRLTNQRIAEVGHLESMISKIKQAAEDARALLRSAIDHVLSDEWLYKPKAFIDRLKELGISVKDKAKDWVYRMEIGPDAGAEATGADLGEEYTKESIEARLRSQGERLASSYDEHAIRALQRQIKTIESGNLPPVALAELADLDRQIRQAVHLVSQAQREAEQAGIFARGKARQHAEQAAGQAQARLAHLVPWWRGEITPETANSVPESVHNQAEQMMRAEASDSLDGLRSDLETQNIYKDAHDHVETLTRIERYKKWGIFDKPDLRKLDNPTSGHPTPSPQATHANQHRQSRSR
ncbi:MAG: MobA/MobL family protein [Acidobacteriota bacterium]|nr:MobA/MobL family protein [Acidobacteriota bacterium]